jgi:hypothetical protein
MDSFRRIRPWDENIGTDASIVNVTRGKRAINRGTDKQISNVTVPVAGGAAFFREKPDPARRDARDAYFDTRGGVWRAYREAMAGDDARPRGPKVFFTRHKSADVHRALRGGMERRVDAVERAVVAQREEDRLQRLETLRRHELALDGQEEFLRARAAVRGFEGTAKPSLRLAPAPMAPTDIETAEALRLGALRKSGPVAAPQQAALLPCVGTATSGNDPSSLPNLSQRRWAPHAKIVS